MDTKMKDLDSYLAEPTIASRPPPYSECYPEPHEPVVHPNNKDIQGATVIQGAPVVQTFIITNNLAPGPTRCVCPTCKQQIVTSVDKVPSMRTHLWAGLLCFLGGILCVWIPYCVDSCQKIKHYCPNCDTYIGAYD